KNRIPIALIGVGSRGGIWNFRQKNLLRKLAESGLVEVCMVRDEFALEILKEYGFDDVKLILDPAFFVTPLVTDDSFNILGWRDYTAHEKVTLRDYAKRSLEKVRGNQREFRTFVKWYDRFMQDVFHQFSSPKIVVVHDNREIKRAEELFGKEHVFYSTDYREIFKVYSAAKTYIGSRIHGAIPSVVHGACVNLLYLIDKAHVFENSAEILSKHDVGIKNSMKVVYIKNRNVSFPQDFVDSTPDRNAIRCALEKEKANIQKILKERKVLSTFLK
ncbi:MAG: polysaccharide pyruvyl transferase family protein, partial [Planctomycetota bacterium]